MSRFITFEGGEGVGKSTQMRRLAARLGEREQRVVTTREPGGSPRAERLRQVLLTGRAKPFGQLAETVLLASARADHVDRVIRPALEQGAWVLCDRFIDSTRAYQGVLGDVDGDVISALERVAAGDCVPDLSLILDAPTELGLGRAGARAGEGARDRFEAEDQAFHERLRRAFIDICRHEPDRCVLIDATGAENEVADRIWDVVSRRFDLTSVAPA